MKGTSANPPSAGDADLWGAWAEAQQRLRAGLRAEGCWPGRLSSSALATAIAVFALGQADRAVHQRRIQAGLDWLAANANADGGWGDTPNSPSNLSTTLLAWSAFSLADKDNTVYRQTEQTAEAWLDRGVGGRAPEQLTAAVLAVYGQDRTFSAPILAVLALAGRLGAGGWTRVPQLPFEGAVLPPRCFKWLRLTVVSYAIPALIAIGLVRFHHGSGAGPVRDWVRRWVTPRVLGRLTRIQPSNGGFLEATPLTAFVVMGLAAAEHRQHPVTRRGVQFLESSVRPDGSWAIDTNLATWLTTLAVKSLAAGPAPVLSAVDQAAIRGWLLAQQYQIEHPFTHAAPGAWAWTDLPGGVPDADDTAGALLALRRLGAVDAEARRAATAGVRWLLDLQNRDGGIPTFCRGWGKLPFDRSCPDITAHAVRAWWEWRSDLGPGLQRRLDGALRRALAYLARAQRADGAWIPLWFGHQSAPRHENPTYGTAQVIMGLNPLAAAGYPEAAPLLARGRHWLESAQNADGSWGGDVAVAGSVEETALAASALAGGGWGPGLDRTSAWLLAQMRSGPGLAPAPIGLYFASLWYAEELYPWIFLAGALGELAAAKGLHFSTAELTSKPTSAGS